MEKCEKIRARIIVYNTKNNIYIYIYSKNLYYIIRVLHRSVLLHQHPTIYTEVRFFFFTFDNTD